MKITAIDSELYGEQILTVDPPLARRVDAGWRRRLHLFTGRGLSHDSLAAEQRHRAGHLAVLGQTLSPGVVQGLEADLEEGPDGPVLHVAPGWGLTDRGEDVIVPRPLHARLDDLRVRAPADFLDGGALPSLPTGQVLPRRLGSTLGQLRQERVLSVPLFVVLQPIVGERIGDFDPKDPCERDPASEAFEDQQLVDGVRLLLELWPTELMLATALFAQRNSLVYRLFEHERSGRPAPWCDAGLPLALLGRRQVDRSYWIDHHAVVRLGGRPRERQALTPNQHLVGPPPGEPDRFLRRARLEQFAEHLGELYASAGAGLLASDHFWYLPPAGLLPRRLVDLDLGTLSTSFLPSHFLLTATPLPLGELDAALAASAGLTRLDVVLGPSTRRLRREERVEILVPVPEHLYEPDLLVEETLDPAFTTTVDKFVEVRAEWRQRRDDVRSKWASLESLISGKPPVLTDDDPEDETPATDTLDPPEAGYSYLPVRQKLYNSWPRSLDKDLGELKKYIEPDLENAEKGLENFVDKLEARVKRADDRIDFSFLRTQTDIYRVRQLMLGTDAATRLATWPPLADIAQRTSAAATRDDLEKFAQRFNIDVSGSGGDGSRTGTSGDGGSGGGTSSGSASGSGDSAAASELTYNVVQPSVISVGTVASSIFEQISFEQVVEQAPLVGDTYDFRTVTIAERLRQDPTTETRGFALSSKIEAVKAIGDLDLVIDDLEVPGVSVTDRDGTSRKANIIDLRLNPKLITEQATLPTNADEAALFGAAVELMDHTIVLLRHLERRVHTYRLALRLSRKALADVRGVRAKARARLDVLGKELAEARHDVRVAESLKAEEEERIAAINKRRRRILADEVRFLAYRRRRTTDLLCKAPARRLEPALTEDPVVACLARPLEVPAELRTMVELFREAPVRWFRQLPKLLDQLDRPETLRGTLVNASLRAVRLTAASPATSTAAAADSGVSPGTLQKSLVQTLSVHRQLVAEQRLEVAQLDVSGLEKLSWLDTRRKAEKLVSVGDLLDARHGRPAVTQRASRELDEIARLAACLYAGFGEIKASIRLDWATRLSQFDQPVDLSDLSRLPGWKGIDSIERRELQALADAIYHRLDPKRQDALALAHDLVRVCVLLASHAPVKRIVSGKVDEPAPVKKDGLVKVRVDVLKPIRIGMPVLFFTAQKTAARGIVNDMTGNVATARVVETFEDNVQLIQGARVEFAETQAFERTGLGSARFGSGRSFSEVS